jgi:Ca2+-binding RTX toxin-like protein
VLVSNDAPAKFPLGETIVTWRALDHGNNQIEATQRVTAILGDDPSCCPEGTTIKVGTAGNDVITGTNGPDCLLGLGGIDRISAKGGNDFVSGGDGNDIIDAMSGNNVVHGGAGNDQISTGPGNDIVVGHAGDDVCDAGLGTNAVSCEVAANCTAACCATNTCDDDVLDPNACGATYSQGSCLSFIQGSVVERNGHNWLCSDGNCRNCASHSSCAPGGTGCPWGVVWTDLGACN